ncbi:MAG: imidazoleglycerol-phosphate dehydratase HisB [Actinomycetota bacterium]|nr:imidazoleglycerol-phosphate dehydratase HisB [Actinomycetota bacterium]
MSRAAEVSRETAETVVSVSLDLDGPPSGTQSTGLPFFDHMLAQICRHGGMALDVSVKGDLDVDAHHSVEDAGLALGRALDQALGDRAGIARFASVSLPLDEALVDVAVDLSGRPFLYWEVELPCGTPPLGTPGFDPQLAEEFWRAVVSAAGITLHVQRRRGVNTHHVVEATFKAVARALRQAVAVVGEGVPSTKGAL